MKINTRMIIPLMICMLMFSNSISTQILEDVVEKEPQLVDARSTACASDVCLSELLVNAQGGSETGAVSTLNWASAEWVELHNSGPNTVDLTGWKLRDNMNRDMDLDTSRIVYPQGASDMNIPAGGYIIVARNGDGAGCGFCLSNDGATYTRSASLIDDSGNSVHEATWGYYVSEGVSLIENPADPLADWIESNQLTPGASNGNASVPESVMCEDICVNEVIPNPMGNDSRNWPDGEWIELFNNGSNDVNLSGWGMALDSGDYTNNLLDFAIDFDTNDEQDWILEPNEYLLLGLNTSDNFVLRNNADELSIKRPNGSIAHTAEWLSAPSGSSLVAPSQSSINNYWVRPPYMTPGWENPVNLQDSVNGTSELKISEVVAYPDSSNENTVPNGEWIELVNEGDLPINLSGWKIRNGTWDTIELENYIVAGGNSETGNLDAGKYLIIGNVSEFIIQNFYEVLWLIAPNESVVQAIHWNTSSMGLGLIEDLNGTIDDPWISFMPTPGAPNIEPPPDYDDEAGFVLTRIFANGNPNSNSCNTYVEIKNVGNTTSTLHGWKLSFNGEDIGLNGIDEFSFADISISAGNSIKIGTGESDVQNYLQNNGGVQAYYWWDIATNKETLEEADIGKTCIYHDSLISLENPNSTYIDAVALPDSSPPLEGWSGAAINLPNSISNENTIIFVRGNGCEFLPDSNTSSDWEITWSKFGRSTHCDFDYQTFSNTKITPMIGPSDGLYQMVNWIETAESSLHVHMYEFTSFKLANSLIDAVNRGVDTTVLIEKYPYSNYDLTTTRGIVYELDQAGVEVLWFTTGSAQAPQPYAYNHAKAVVLDEQEIWLGSGNFKDSSFPNRQQYEANGEIVLFGSDGNREWGIFVNSSTLANKLLDRMSWDENTDHPHIEAYDPGEPQFDKPDSWSGLPTSNLPLDPPLYTIPEFEGDFDGKLLSCPDDCANAIISSINNAESSILLSLQYLDLDWWYGWSEESNPWGDSLIVGALERAAERGVSIRLIINEYYADESPEVQQATNLLNEIWNHTYGYDTAAIMMSAGGDDRILKLHNKGMIIDSETILIGSMNWGSNSLLQNREYGLLLNSSELAQYYIESWTSDWERLDLWTDTDGDGLPDHWEVSFGLNRTTSIIPGTAITEHSYDPDGDGLNNLEEYNYAGDPLSPDTDGDCIPDLLEISFAQIEGISARAAMKETDANDNGIDDGIETECGLNLEEIDVDTTSDSDNDGVVDINDLCQNTEENIPVNIDGCPLDSDGDGVNDFDNSGGVLDLCENTPSGTNVDSNGCEIISENDIDNDGVIDSEDSCLDTPEGLDVDSNGCSDSDNDGIIDSIDECPETLPGTIVGSTGCTPSQEKTNDDENEENRLGNGAAADDKLSLFILILMGFAAIAFVGSIAIFFTNRNNPTEEIFADLTNEVIDDAAMGLEDPDLGDDENPTFASPILDAVTGATASEDEHRKAVFSAPVLDGTESLKYDENDESIDLPGWTRDVVEAYIAQGWSMEQLKEWYNENS